MSSQSRLLEVLSCFSVETPLVRAEDLARTLGLSISTAYRYLGTLRRHGLVEQAAGDRFMLGGRVAALDRVMRHTDPVLVAARAPMRDLARDLGHTVTLTRLFGNDLMSVWQEDGATPVVVGYDRGQTMPLFRGCTGKVILARLPWRRLRALHAANAPTIRRAGLGENWRQFLAAVRDCRSQPVLWTSGEIRPDNTGAAIALEGPDGSPAGSLTVIIPDARAATANRAEVEAGLCACVRATAHRLDAMKPAPETVDDFRC